MKSFHRSERIAAAKNPRDLNVLGRELLDRLDPRGFSLRQLMWYVFAVSLALIVGLQLPKILAGAYESWRLGREFDAVVYREPGFDVRIRGLVERGTMLASPGIFYRYEVREHGWFTAWRRIAQVRILEEKPIAREHFVRVSKDVCYFFSERAFGISVDGGVNWRCCDVDGLMLTVGNSSGDYHRIDSLEIDVSGEGTATLIGIDPGTQRPTLQVQLKSSDFGQTWVEGE